MIKQEQEQTISLPLLDKEINLYSSKKNDIQKRLRKDNLSHFLTTISIMPLTYNRIFY